MAALYETRRNGSFVNQTTGIQNLDLEAYMSLSVHMPTFLEQEQLARRLDEERDQMVSVRAALEQSTRLLNERQQALITAAVTGEIDVTTARGGVSHVA